MSAFTQEQRAFLLHGTRTGKLATVRKDGRPHVVPIWFTLDGDTLVFTTGEHTAKMANMRRDARVSLCVDDETPPYALGMPMIAASSILSNLLHLSRKCTIQRIAHSNIGV